MASSSGQKKLELHMIQRWQEEVKHENLGQSYNSDNNDNPCDSDSMSELSTLS